MADPVRRDRNRVSFPALVKTAIDLVLGRPRVALAPSRLLAGEVTTPYGNAPTDDVVAAAWRNEAGDRDCPPWMILGREDAPSGTIWRFAWCPATSAMPEHAEIVLPEALWALELLNDMDSPPGWHLRALESPSGTWVGIWHGSRCDHLQLPGKDREQALERGRSGLAKRGIQNPQALDASWIAPNAARLSEMADASPESDLVEIKESIRRQERKSVAASVARTAAVVAALALVSGLLGAFQGWHAYRRSAEESRLQAVKPLVDGAAELARHRERDLASLRSFRDALEPGHAADRVVAGIASALPAGARLQTLALEQTSTGWRLRTEARLPDWGSIQPLSQGLRQVAGVTKVTVANQSRQADAVSAILEVEGTWP